MAELPPAATVPKTSLHKEKLFVSSLRLLDHYCLVSLLSLDYDSSYWLTLYLLLAKFGPEVRKTEDLLEEDVKFDS